MSFLNAIIRLFLTKKVINLSANIISDIVFTISGGKDLESKILKEKSELKKLKQQIQANKNELKKIRKSYTKKCDTVNYVEEKQDTEDPALFLAYNHYRLYHYPCEMENLYLLFQKMIRHIENKLNIKFQLLPIPDGFDPVIENKINFYLTESEEKLLSLKELKLFHLYSDFSSITEFAEARRTGSKNKKDYYYNLANVPCSTEDIVREYLKQQGYQVLYCENNFWIPLSVLAFADEIYSEGWQGVQTTPFHLGRKNLSELMPELYNRKIELLKNCDLHEFIQEQIEYFGFINYNKFRCGNTDYIQYIDEQGGELLKRIPNEYFIKIASNILNHPKRYSRGLPDFCCWDNDEFIFVEAKRMREKMRDEQINWGAYFREQNIPYKIVRVKSIED